MNSTIEINVSYPRELGLDMNMALTKYPNSDICLSVLKNILARGKICNFR